MKLPTLLSALAALTTTVMALDPTFSLSSIDGPGGMVTAECNLPDGMSLLCTLESADGTYSGQGKFVVKDGRVTAGPYSNNENPLPPGDYIFDIKSGLPSLQPKAVQEVIGRLGENLSGKNAKTFIDSKVVEVSIPIKIESEFAADPRATKAESMSDLKNLYEDSMAKNAAVYTELDPLKIKVRIDQEEDATGLETFLKKNGFKRPTVTEGLKLVGPSNTLWECEVVEGGETASFVVLATSNDFAEGRVILKKQPSPW